MNHSDWQTVRSVAALALGVVLLAAAYGISLTTGGC